MKSNSLRLFPRFTHHTQYTHREYIVSAVPPQRGFSVSTRTHPGFTVPPNHIRNPPRIQPRVSSIYIVDLTTKATRIKKNEKRKKRKKATRIKKNEKRKKRKSINLLITK